jgi:hypothetical protein
MGVELLERAQVFAEDKAVVFGDVWVRIEVRVHC